ncbi:MAG TPA: 6-phosphogluconolactonase [Solirubrobacteraceae bacterium]|nr:6-phosphogluconolactonase [Solirubrobacteraceae bacterium]
MHPVPPPLVLADEERVGATAAEVIANRLLARPSLRMLLSGERTPMGMYAALRAHARHGELMSRGATVLQLDEYVGLAPTDPHSRSARLAHEMRGIDLHALHGLDGTAAHLGEECERHQRLLDAAPLDLAVLGLGADGHVAFDEPGSRLDEPTRVVQLTGHTRAELTGEVGSVPDRALTVGLGSLLQARELLVTAIGASRAAALRSMLVDPPSPATPASLLRAHPRLTVICDRSAAGELPVHRGGHHVCVVLGHREPSISAEHRISHESLGRLHRAEWIARRRPTLAAVLTGYTSTGGLSEAEQMRAAWNVEDVPPLLEVAGRDTAENATRSLPLVLALGDARRVTVVTSAWHVRAPYHFRAWRRYGLEVGFAFDWRGDWSRMLAHELRGMRTTRAERRRAIAAMALPPSD